MGDFLVSKDEVLNGMTYTYKCLANKNGGDGLDITSNVGIDKDGKAVHSDYTVIPFSDREAIKLRDYLLAYYPIEAQP